METKKDKIKGLIGTLLFHLVVLIIFLLVGFTTPLPLPEEIGVEIQGGSSFGMGDNIQMDATSANVKQTQPQPKSSDNNDYVTQNTEEAYNIDKTKNNSDAKNVNETNTKNKVTKWIPDGSIFSKNQGNANNIGNESYGSKDGEGVGNNNNSGKGLGNGPGTGIGYDLEGRNASYLPSPDKNFSESGTVAITIWVDKNGNVVGVRYDPRKSNTTSMKLRNLAIEAAKKSKFSPKADAPEEQMGTITYIFVTQ
ncbi:MAG TPA: TonB family protein [Bacteroidales bacterium]|nr:TonB family protein [Bacteroidales bacterium]